MALAAGATAVVATLVMGDLDDARVRRSGLNAVASVLDVDDPAKGVSDGLCTRLGTCTYMPDVPRFVPRQPLLQTHAPTQYAANVETQTGTIGNSTRARPPFAPYVATPIHEPSIAVTPTPSHV